MKRTTIKDVAAHAGVSTATVSRVLSKEPNVALDIADNVRRSAEKLNYRPSVMARSLTNSKTDLVALVVGRLHNPFDARLCEALAESLKRSGKRLLLVPADYGGNDPAAMIALDYQVDAVIVAAGHLSKDSAERFAQLGVPVILYGRTLEAPGMDCIVADNFGAGRMIGQLFRQSKLKCAAFICHVRKTFSDDEREAGFREGLGPNISLDVIKCTKKTSRETALNTLLALERPDGLFCANDVLAFGVIEAAIQIGLEIPRDLVVAGFDDVDMASSPFYDLTTFRQSPREIADWIVSRISKRLSNPGIKVVTKRIPTRIKLRGTTPSRNIIGGVNIIRHIGKEAT
ncbi:MAG: LacI family DNA-binding transcriptional regulator [Aestuariivita sp.]|nr:LacI family DNA-binding transcriptional regulator [Aestuariivita sp.]